MEQLELDRLHITYAEEFKPSRAVIVITIPCGCHVKVTPEVKNTLGTPVQFAFYCNAHFPY